MRDKIEIQYLNKEAYTMILQKLRQFMYGRYGGDQLCIGLFVLAILCQIVYVFTRFWPLYLLSLVLYGIDIFRILSRNIPKRQAENLKFMNIIWKVKNFWVSIKSDFEQAKTYKRPKNKNPPRPWQSRDLLPQMLNPLYQKSLSIELSTNLLGEFYEQKAFTYNQSCFGNAAGAALYSKDLRCPFRRRMGRFHNAYRKTRRCRRLG